MNKFYNLPFGRFGFGKVKPFGDDRKGTPESSSIFQQNSNVTRSDHDLFYGHFKGGQ